ncbi:MAG TPA: lytic murein transglycosylase [Solirubrobacteraceae bacterium]|jgi:membrane-bound lytic murein transglycosylase B
MPPVNSARRRAVRAALSALAGGGLTAAGLGGPLSAAALGAEATTSSSGIETTTVPAPAPPTPAPAPTPGAQPTTSTSTPSSTPASTTPVPVPPAPATPSPAAEPAPTVVLHRRQKTTSGSKTQPSETATKLKSKSAKELAAKATGPNNVAASPQVVAQAGALAAILASSDASAQALAFYRIPLFLLPIYKAAAVQYGVPWQILAAINEIETNYGTDQSVSTAGAVGWMQFMPSTWLSYGVDALDANYADPYNPVDAIFAAARYLRAAGAATNLRTAILAYNHSNEYADSVLLRAKLISTYPKSVIATLTGLIDSRLPVTGGHVAWTALPPTTLRPASATGNAVAVPSSHAASATPGSSAPPSPALAAAAATSKRAAAEAEILQQVDLTSIPTASVVAVQDGRVVGLGQSHGLGRYVMLKDVYGDVFTYAGLGSIARTYTASKPTRGKVKSAGVEAAGKHDPAPALPASAGSQPPVTLNVKVPAKHAPAKAHGSAAVAPEALPASTGGKVRLFAHPGNPDARAAAVVRAARRARTSSAPRPQPLRRGSVVTSGTVLGRVRVPAGAHVGHLRFAITPAGDPGTIEPGPIISNWAQLQRALHPQGAKAPNPLLGATASDVFLLSRTALERTVLSDPGITLPACARHDVASGSVDRRVLAVLAFLSRSGLKPKLDSLRCGRSASGSATLSLAQAKGDAVAISAINGIPIAGHQGPGTITDLTVRTLLTLPREFVPQEIVSLMRYPGAKNTHARSAYWSRLALDFGTATPAASIPSTVGAKGAAHSAKSGSTAPVPLVTTTVMSTSQWSQLMARIAGLPSPSVATKPSTSAIADPKPKHG